MWFGVLFTILVEFYPSHGRATAVACFIFVINNIGGNAQLIVPPIADAIGLKEALFIVYPGFYLTSKLQVFYIYVLPQIRVTSRVFIRLNTRERASFGLKVVATNFESRGPVRANICL